MGTTYAGYHPIRANDLRPLTDQEETALMEKLSEEYRREAERRVWMYKSALSAELNWNRHHAPVPVHLLRLKKPIMPERWRGYRDGWDRPFEWPEWTGELLGIEKLKDELLRKRHTPYSEMYFDRNRMVVGWRVPPEVEG